MPILKDKSVSCDGLSDKMHYAAGIVDMIYRTEADKPAVYTSMLDGTHNSGSLHPKGFAFDVRTKNLPAAKRGLIFSKISEILRPLGFDVCWEGPGATPATTAQHIHVEYDPKPGSRFWSLENPAAEKEAATA